MGKRTAIDDVRDAFGSELYTGQRSALVSWLAFTGTFSGARGVTHAIKAGRGPFKNLSVGGEHLHHPPRPAARPLLARPRHPWPQFLHLEHDHERLLLRAR